MSRRESNNSIGSAQNRLFGMPGRFGGTPTHTPSATPAGVTPTASVPPTPQAGASRGLTAKKGGPAGPNDYLPQGVDRGGPPVRPSAGGDYGLDSNIADIVAKRGREPPSLQYLQFGVPTTHGQSFGYSEEMLEALGEKKDGSRPRRPNDMPSPWAVEPEELNEPALSLYGKDFEGKQLHKSKGQTEESRAAELAERSKKLKAEIERKRAEGREAIMKGGLGGQRRSTTTTAAKSDSNDEEVKTFDHYGVYRRPKSTPLETQVGLVKEYNKQHNALHSSSGAKAIPDICNPLLGGESIFAWNPNSVAMAVEKEGGAGKKTPTAFWYPKDKQLKKHQRLENQRWEDGSSVLQANGWDTSTIVGTRDKKITNPEFQTTLSKDDQRKVDEQLEVYRQQMEAKKQIKKERQAAALKAEREKEETLAKKKAHSRSSRGVLGGLQGLNGEEFSTTSGDYGATRSRLDNHRDSQDTNTTQEQSEDGLSPQQMRGTLHVPDAAFRAELPGARLPQGQEKEKLMKLTMPPVKAGDEDSSPAPPWGRPTALDEKNATRYAQVKVFNTRNKKMKIQTTGKLDVDRELRVIRDGGLQKKEKASLLKTVDPEQLKYIKQMGNAAMRQTRNPPSSM